jgi:hypothetical protein
MFFNNPRGITESATEPGMIRDSRYLATFCATRVQREERMVKREPMLERRDEVMPEPGGYFELGGCLSSFVYDLALRMTESLK